MDRYFALKSLSAACRYHNQDKKTVFSEGDPYSKIMFVGEALGKDEVRLGRPFVGAAGKKLDIFLDKLGLLRDNVYITNVVKFRPTTVKQDRNRPPTEEEIEAFSYYLNKEVDIVDPTLIVTLGAIPLRFFYGQNARITRLHGTYAENSGRNLFFLYHPAAVLYKEELLVVYENDLETLRLYLKKHNYI